MVKECAKRCEVASMQGFFLLVCRIYFPLFRGSTNYTNSVIGGVASIPPHESLVGEDVTKTQSIR